MTLEDQISQMANPLEKWLKQTLETGKIPNYLAGERRE